MVHCTAEAKHGGLFISIVLQDGVKSRINNFLVFTLFLRAHIVVGFDVGVGLITFSEVNENHTVDF